jgi:hypothetical protein
MAEPRRLRSLEQDLAVIASGTSYSSRGAARPAQDLTREPECVLS